jgi:hypothetical protein
MTFCAGSLHSRKPMINKETPLISPRKQGEIRFGDPPLIPP